MRTKVLTPAITGAYTLALLVGLAACGSKGAQPSSSAAPGHADAPAPAATVSSAASAKPTSPPFATAPDAAGPVVFGIRDAGTYMFDKGAVKKVELANLKDVHQLKDGRVLLSGEMESAWLSPDGEATRQLGMFGAVGVGADGSVWLLELGSPPAVARIEDAGAREKHGGDPLPDAKDDFVEHVAVDAKGNPYAASRNKVWARRDGNWKVFKGSDLGLGDAMIEGLLPVGDDVYAVGGTGASTVDGKKLSLPPTTAGVVYIKGTPFRSAKGDVAFHTGLEAIVVHADGKSESHPVGALAPGAQSTYGAAIDTQGRLWVGTDAGVVVWSKDAKSAIVLPPGALPGAAEVIAPIGAGPELSKTAPAVVKGDIKGRLVVNGKPFPNAEIMACDSPASVMEGPTPCSGRPVVVSGKTDDDGVFHMKDVAAWSYGFALKDKAGWLISLGTTLGKCCGNVKAGQEIDIGDLRFDLHE